MKLTIEIDGTKHSGSTENYINSKFKIFEDVIGEYSQFRYLVCKDFCSKATIRGAFNKLQEAEEFCLFQNVISEMSM